MLFVCSRNRLRSPTAEQVFATWPGVETDSAGTDADADVQVGVDAIEWADVVFVMEATHRQKIQKRFRSRLKAKVICLDIPDRFVFMDPDLVRILERKVAPYLPERGGP